MGSGLLAIAATQTRSNRHPTCLLDVRTNPCTPSHLLVLRIMEVQRGLG